MKDIVEQLREWAELKWAIDHDEVGRFKLEDAVAEIERLRAERDALLNFCVAELHAQDEVRKHGYTHISFEGWSEPDDEEDDEEWATEAVAICLRSRAEAVAAVRRAAGLGPEAVP